MTSLEVKGVCQDCGEMLTGDLHICEGREDQPQKMKHIKVINKLTGEIIKIGYDSPAELAQQYEDLSALITTLDRAKKKMRDNIAEFMADQDEFRAGPAFTFVKEYRQIWKYDKSVLKKHLDEDQLDMILEPNSKKTKELLTELVLTGALPKDAGHDIEDNKVLERTDTAIKLKKD